MKNGQVNGYKQSSLRLGKRDIKENNIFILDCGEIERFVPDVPGHGNNWVENTFIKYAEIEAEVYHEARNFMKMILNHNSKIVN